jgi:hypothetical protein
MNRRSLLLIPVLGMLTAGLCFTFMPFIVSLAPNARAHAALPRISVAEMQPGSFKFVLDPRSINNFPVGLMIVKYETGSFDVWNIPFKDNTPHIPERWWWQSMYKCPSLQVDFENKIIICPTGAIADWHKENEYSPAYEWTLNGEFKGKEYWIPNLERVPTQVELGSLVIGVR